MSDSIRQDKGLAVPSGRVSRFARLGRVTAGVAGSMALGGLRDLGRGQRPRMQDLLLTPANVRRVADELAKMRGAAMKMGQLMSMDTGEVLPPELAEIMARLRDDAHIMPPKQLKAVLTDQWGEGWLRQFRRFDVRPIAAASIGQVHRAQTLDGRDLAIKVQYPGVADSIDSDVANVGALVKLTGLLPKGFALAPYLEEAKRQLHEETDYTAEARALQQFRVALSGDGRFVLPDLAEDLSTQRILAMSYVDSAPIETVAEADQEVRDRVAGELIDLMLAELFDLRLMQTDPNFANYRWVPETGQIVLLDFGATRALLPHTVEAYRALFKAGLDGDRVAMERAAEDIGFLGDEAPDHRRQILSMMEEVFAALRGTETFDFGDRSLSQAMTVKGMALAESGYVPPPLPMDAVFLQRKFGGMFLLAARLGAQLPVESMVRARL